MITQKEVLINFIWKMAERCGSQIISFVVSIILARLLMPSDYGMIALCMVFILILQVFADSGLATALIQKKIRITWIILPFSIRICAFRYFFME